MNGTAQGARARFGLGRDGLAGLAVFALCLWLIADTRGLSASALVPIGPGVYPRIVLGITALFGAWLAVADLLAHRHAATAPAAAAARVNRLLVALGFAAFALYALALPLLGFRLASFAFVAGLNLLLDPPRRARHLLRAALLAFATAALTHWVFESHLSVLLPRGAWTGF